MAGAKSAATGGTQRRRRAPAKLTTPARTPKIRRGVEAVDFVPSATCQKCGAWKGELGQEPDPQLFAEHLADIFAAIPLRDDGLIFVNMMDSYIANQKGTGPGAKANEGLRKGRDDDKVEVGKGAGMNAEQRAAVRALGLKGKDMAGVPWRFAFAMQVRGFYWRDNIVWAKQNRFPESATDRLCKCHESILMFSRAPDYYFNPRALRERPSDVSVARDFRGRSAAHKFYAEADKVGGNQGINQPRKKGQPPKKKYKYRKTDNVWHLPTAAHRSRVGSHVAVMPVEIPLRCVKLASRPGDLVVDPFCGAGTACFAAAKMKRRFAGADLDERAPKWMREWYDRHSSLKSGYFFDEVI